LRVARAEGPERATPRGRRARSGGPFVLSAAQNEIGRLGRAMLIIF